jgi:predicted Co/Zn/Cd cation transporter (cation efflux family)
MDQILTLAANQWPMATLVALAFIQGWIVAGYQWQWLLKRQDRLDDEMVQSIKELAVFVKETRRGR